jgi:hypothetical protein
MKIIITENKLNQIGIKWLNKHFGDLKPYETEKEPDYIFYMKDGQIIFDYNKKNGDVYLDYDEIWSFFETVFGMTYQQIEDITKAWVEEHYKLRVTTTFSIFSLQFIRWRNITN